MGRESDKPSGDRIWRERGLRAAVLAGDEQAWRTWYVECFADLFAYIQWRCAGAREPAEEVAQETWLIAVRQMRKFDPETGSFAGWLRGIAANVLRNRFRRVRAQPRLESLNGQEPAASVAEHAAPETSRRIAQALAALPDHYEAVLRAKYLEQQSVADIAAARDESAKAIESLLTRARQAFRDVYSQQE